MKGRIVLSICALTALVLPACGDDGENTSGAGGSGGTGASSGSGASSGTGASTGAGGDPGPPKATCDVPVQPADVSKPTTVVGDGTPQSCTEAALDAAIAQGGVITFNCGAAPHTLTVAAEKVITKDTILDGGGTVTLSGGGTTRILAIHSTFDKDTPKLTVQRLGFTGGHVEDVPNTKEVKAGGAAIFRLGGTLTVIDSKFEDNHCAQTGQDVSGGAITSQGGGLTTIVGSVFQSNSGSNGGAIGNLGNSLTIVNSVINGNKATGKGGNPGDGGNGGGVVIDGQGTTITICGTTISNNIGNAFGGGLFRVSYQQEPTNIDKCAIEGNTIPDQDPSMAGGLYLQGTTVTLTNSTIAGNGAKSSGGVYLGPQSIANLTNVTIAENTAWKSLGGGMAVDGSVKGTLLNCTIAKNAAPGDVAFAGAIAGGEGLSLANTIVSDNEAGNGYNPISCTKKLANGGGNLQFPVMRKGAGSDDPDALCSDNILIADAMLGPLQDNGGPTRTMAPKPGSPAIDHGTNCPATDQTGKPRKSTCASGAFEP